jgi:hypothetical protein
MAQCEHTSVQLKHRGLLGIFLLGAVLVQLLKLAYILSSVEL